MAGSVPLSKDQDFPMIDAWDCLKVGDDVSRKANQAAQLIPTATDLCVASIGQDILKKSVLPLPDFSVFSAFQSVTRAHDESLSHALPHSPNRTHDDSSAPHTPPRPPSKAQEASPPHISTSFPSRTYEASAIHTPSPKKRAIAFDPSGVSQKSSPDKAGVFPPFNIPAGAFPRPDISLVLHMHSDKSVPRAFSPHTSPQKRDAVSAGIPPVSSMPSPHFAKVPCQHLEDSPLRSALADSLGKVVIRDRDKVPFLVRLQLAEEEEESKTRTVVTTADASAEPPLLCPPPDVQPSSALRSLVDKNYDKALILCKNIPKILSKISRSDLAIRLFHDLESMSKGLKSDDQAAASSVKKAEVHVHSIIALSGQHDNWSAAAQPGGRAQQVQPVFWAQPVID